MDNETKNYLDNMRLQSSNEHTDLKNIMLNIQDQISGNEGKGIEGIRPVLKKHKEVLAPLIWLKEHKAASVLLGILTVTGSSELGGHGLIHILLELFK